MTGVGQSIAAVCCTSSCAGVVVRGERGGLGSAGVAARHEKWGRVAQWGPATLPVATQQACSHSLPLLARNHAKCDWRSTSDHVKVTCERAVKKWTKALKVRHQVFCSSIHILRLGDIYPCDIYPCDIYPWRHLPMGDIYPWHLPDMMLDLPDIW